MRLKKPSVSCTVKPIVRSSYQLVSFCFVRLGALVVKPLTPRASQLAVVVLMLLMTHQVFYEVKKAISLVYS